MRKPTIGLLPLYLKLYDDTMPAMRDAFTPFLQTIVDGLEAAGVAVCRGEIAREEAEVRAAVAQFEVQEVDCIVTVHLAYSLSLASVDALVATSRPLVLLDTTMDPAFGRDAKPDRLFTNHGIHGVQDLASTLVRKRRAFDIVAGHVTESNALARVADHARAATSARVLRSLRVLRIGEPFAGMGDFQVPESVLADRLGVEVDAMDPAQLDAAVEDVTDTAIDAEIRRDRERFTVDCPDDVHRRSVRVGLGLRRFLEDGNYGAFSMNFLAFDAADGPVDTVPFLEASKAMARGVGYAGEGDVLTASLVGALGGGFGRTTFTEMFCPDWKGGALFCSHMGEINHALSAVEPVLCEKDFPWTPASNPAIVACAPAPGLATLVNLAPGPDDTFRLIVSLVEILNDSDATEWQQAVRAWIRPPCPLEMFLERYSRLGGTHHCALMLGEHVEALTAFARAAGMGSVVV